MSPNAPTELTGPASRSCLPCVTLRGNSYQRGVQYGREFSAHLDRFYDWFVRRQPDDLLTPEYRSVLDDMTQASARHFPQLLDFVKGEADGARLSYEKCRIMAFHNEISNVLRPGCSNILVTDAANGRPWLARNCDLFQPERSWQVRIACHADDCQSHAGVTYLGLPLGVGVNGAGLAVGGASLPCCPPEIINGMPNMVPYLLWTQRSVADSVQQIGALGFLGKGSNLVLLDASGTGAVVEMGGGQHVVRQVGGDGFLVATNHSVSGQLRCPASADPTYLQNSQTRYDRLMAVLAATAPKDRTVEFAFRTLGDREGPWPVCERVAGGFHTIYSTVIQPRPAGYRMWLCWGYPDEQAFTMSEFGGAGGDAAANHAMRGTSRTGGAT